MANFKFQFQSQDGQTIDFLPMRIRPFSVDELLASFDGPGRSYELHIEAENPTVNTEIQEGIGTIKAKINFERTPSPYALVPGGWLPMPLAMPTKFLVDRNVIAQLKRIRDGEQRFDSTEVAWWSRLFKEGTATFNALPYAWESNKRRAPSYDEFCSSMEEGTQELVAAFPLCKVITFGDGAFNAAYEMLSRFQSKSASETDFLITTCKLLANRIAKGKEPATLKKIILAAKSTGVEPFSPPFIAALSCLYEDHTGVKFSIGRQLLKPSKYHNPEMAFNAISDIRHIEIAIAGHGHFGENAFNLATCDKALAAFWCATAPIGEVGSESNLEINYHLSNTLMPRLSQLEFESVIDSIRGAF